MNKESSADKRKPRVKNYCHKRHNSQFPIHDSAKLPANRKFGLSAIELLMGLAVIAVIFSIALGPLRSFRDSQILASDTENILSLLKEARSQTVFSKNSSQYGVHFESGRTVLFKGTAFTEPNADNKEFLLHDGLTISDWSLSGGGADIVFERLTGKTTQFGAVTVSLISNPSKVKIINIGETGAAGAN